MKIIGHRGARGLAPENTIASFAKALEYDVDQIEVDLRVTKDNVVVLHHNASLVDQAGNKLKIALTSYDELLSHKPDLTTFSELLDYISARKHLLLEVKQRVPVKPIVTTLKKYIESGKYGTTDVSLASFDQKVLLGLHRALPDIEKIVIERWSGIKARFRARQVQTKRLNMRSWWLWKGFLIGMHRAGYQIAPYTMNDPRKVKKWQKYLYGVVTDYPDLFKK